MPKILQEIEFKWQVFKKSFNIFVLNKASFLKPTDEKNTLTPNFFYHNSKDNYLFAVQSIGKDDNESLPVVPGIGR
nr:hypothetical protein [uncultured Pedobacter sp.]